MRILTKFSMVLFCSFVFVAACTSTPKFEGRTPAGHSDLSVEDAERIHKMVSEKDSVHFTQELLKLRIAQTLVTSFDLRLEKLKSEVELDQLFESNLYCKLMDVRGKHDHTMDELLLAYTYANSL